MIYMEISIQLAKNMNDCVVIMYIVSRGVTRPV